MPSVQNDILVLGATRIAVGLSQIIKVVPGPAQYANTLKYVSGGSLEIVQPQFNGSSTQAGSASLGWGTGNVLSTTEIFALTGQACFYLAATGATSVAALTIGYGSGASFPTGA